MTHHTLTKTAIVWCCVTAVLAGCAEESPVGSVLLGPPMAPAAFYVGECPEPCEEPTGTEDLFMEESILGYIRDDTQFCNTLRAELLIDLWGGNIGVWNANESSSFILGIYDNLNVNPQFRIGISRGNWGLVDNTYNPRQHVTGSLIHEGYHDYYFTRHGHTGTESGAENTIIECYRWDIG